MTPEQILEIIKFLQKLSDNSQNTAEFIYHVTIILNEILLKHLEEMVTPELHHEFKNSFRDAQKKYLIVEHDLPVIRDLKACLNMLHAIENAAQKQLCSHGEPIIAFFNKLEMIQDIYDFRQNYKIFSSTNNILTLYISQAKKFIISVVLPELIQKLNKLSQYITHENLEKLENICIEQLIALEKYKENYIRRKQMIVKDIESEKKDKKEDDFVTFLVKKNDGWVKCIYPEDYFPREIKIESQDSLENILNYYEINTKDSDTIKNLKLLLNGVIGIKKVLNDHEEYQQSGFFQSVGWMTTFVKDLRRAYNSLFQFDYQAIIAEQSNPFTEGIKNQLKKLNFLLEKLACIADNLESELHLKDGYLLNHVELLVERYNQITYELRIPVDYARQKYVYYLARLESNENNLIVIDEQLAKLREFMHYRPFSLFNIPPEIIENLEEYIETYKDDLCMNHERLETYQKYLENTLKAKRGLYTFIVSHFEYAGNYSGLTIHHELMQTLHSRMLYLEKQQKYLEERYDSTVEYYKQNPYMFFKADDKNEVINPKLKAHIAHLSKEKDALSQKSEDEQKNNTILKLEEFNPRLANKLALKTKELNFFQTLTKNYEETEKLTIPEDKVNLPQKSAIILKEMSEVLETSKKGINKSVTPG